MYTKLSGMTGTADTEAYEFQTIYGLEVVVIPTHRPMVRKDSSDLVFLGKEAKFRAVIEDIKDCYERGQPALVGTTSIETSQMLSEQLQAEGVPHEVLNAKQHEREAHIVANAGRPKAITIATNMAGRGTDIVLGGSLEAELHALGEDATEMDKARVKAEWQKRHDEVLALGGLHIIGTERHESRRIDNQLRGRSGRQGDAGSSRFYLSLEDNLMRIFAADWVKNAMRRMGMKDDEVIESSMVSKQIQNAQRKVEAHNFDIRKNLLDFDDVANDQRKVVYQQRNELLESDSVNEAVVAIREDVFTELVRSHVPENSIDSQWDIAGLEATVLSEYGVRLGLAELIESRNHEIEDTELVQYVLDTMARFFEEKEASIGSDVMRQLEKHFMLNVLDQGWKEHLARMDYLRQGIHLRGYAQKQPKQEYKRESFELFTELLDKVKRDVTAVLARFRLRSEEEVQQLEEEDRRRQEAQATRMQFQHADAGGYGTEDEAEQAQALAMAGAGVLAPGRAAPKIGRNDPCPCGSGKKYKQCHGQLT
jgi:preprotein translocase subunit SecA